MDTSYVAVGTIMYMITDNLTYRPQKSPAGAQHERAGRAGCVGQRGRLYRWPPGTLCQPAALPSYTVSPAGQRLKRSRPAPAGRRLPGAFTLPQMKRPPPRPGAVVHAEPSSVLLRRWRLAAWPAVHHGEHNQDDDHRSGPQNPSVLKEVHGHLLCRSRNRHVHDNS